MSRSILVFLETDNMGIEKNSVRLAYLAGLIASREKVMLNVLFIVDRTTIKHDDVKSYMKMLKGISIDNAYFAYGQIAYSPSKYGQIVKIVAKKLDSELIVFSDSKYSKPIASMCSVLNDTAITANCYGIEFAEENMLNLLITNNGKNLKKIITEKNKPAITVVNPHDYKGKFKKTQGLKTKRTKITTRNYTYYVQDRRPLEDYKGIIAIGNGVDDSDIIAKVIEFCDMNNYGFASTKDLVDEGKTPIDSMIDYNMELKPECIIAIGISGDDRLIKVIQGAKRIVTVNTNKNAPLNKVAHEVITADAKDIIPVILGR